MKTFVPDYYDRFACIKGECRHSCCIGWEIDIDEASMEYFHSVPGEIGNRLRENIDESGEVPCFRLAEGGRCPFLNPQGLCDLILELGEDSLCDICADHPRFRNFFSDRTEIGLGLCCEEAARIILTATGKTGFVLMDDDGVDEYLSEDEEIILQLRDDLIAAMQNRSLPVEDRFRYMLETTEIPLPEFEGAEWAGFLIGLERLDEAWTVQLESLMHAQPEALCGAPAGFETAFEQLIVYLLMRHLPGALDDNDLSGRIAFAALIWKLLRSLFALQDEHTMDRLVELCRLYSSEIEYSDENISAILDELHAKNPAL